VTDEQVALYLEEHEPSLQATLLSAVEASRVGKPESAALVRRVIEQAIEKCAAVDGAATGRQAAAAPLRDGAGDDWRHRAALPRVGTGLPAQWREPVVPGVH
jgi:hypothetical protein